MEFTQIFKGAPYGNNNRWGGGKGSDKEQGATSVGAKPSHEDIGRLGRLREYVDSTTGEKRHSFDGVLMRDGKPVGSSGFPAEDITRVEGNTIHRDYTRPDGSKYTISDEFRPVADTPPEPQYADPVKDYQDKVAAGNVTMEDHRTALSEAYNGHYDGSPSGLKFNDAGVARISASAGFEREHLHSDMASTLEEMGWKMQGTPTSNGFTMRSPDGKVEMVAAGNKVQVKDRAGKEDRTLFGVKVR